MPPERQRILVIGGKGFLGSRIAAALRQIEGAEVVVSSRRGGGEVVACDIEDSSSRPAMAGFDVVVNCADGLRAAPEKAAEFCLLSGATFIETTADAVVMERLWETARKVPDPQGTLVLGAGLFPGLSNLLAADLVARHGVPERLEVGVRYCPWSVAGAGVCDLMVEAASRPAVRYEAGERVEDPPVTVAGSFPFSGVQRNALGVGLPEALMLHWSIGVPSARSVLVPVPGLPVAVQRLLTLLGPWPLLRLTPLRWLTGKLLWLLRGGLLRWHRAGVELSVVAERGAEDGRERRALLRVDDGFAAAAHTVAALVALLGERSDAAPGVYLIDQLVQLDLVLERMRDIAGGGLVVDLTRD